MALIGRRAVARRRNRHSRKRTAFCGLPKGRRDRRDRRDRRVHSAAMCNGVNRGTRETFWG